MEVPVRKPISMRKAVALALLLAACDSPLDTDTGTWPRVCVADRVGIVQVPTVSPLDVDAGYARRLLADTITLAADGTARWAVRAELRAPWDTSWVPYTSVSDWRWRVDGGELTLFAPPCIACLSIAGNVPFLRVFDDLVREEGAYGAQRWRYRP